MKKFLSLLNSAVSRVCMAGIALLGFASCASDEPQPDMYGTPLADFEVKGYVKDATGNPVTNATVKMTYRNNHSGVEWIDKGETNGDGAYELEGDLIGFNRYEVKVVCKPSDPTLEADSTVVKLTQIRKGEDMWNQGGFGATVNFVLKKKEAK